MRRPLCGQQALVALEDQEVLHRQQPRFGQRHAQPLRAEALARQEGLQLALLLELVDENIAQGAVIYIFRLESAFGDDQCRVQSLSGQRLSAAGEELCGLRGEVHGQSLQASPDTSCNR